MKKIFKYSAVILALLAAVVLYISYNTSIPVADLVQNAPDYISKLETPDINAEYIENYSSPAQKVMDILHYEINLDLYPEEKKIAGKTIINLIAKGINKIDLNFYDNFKIQSIKVNGNGVKFENEDTRLTLFTSGLLKDTSSIEINYYGKPKNLGFGSFTFGEKNGKSFIYTMSEPVFASTWFPCNDIPTDKAQFDIKITNDSSMVSVSNGNLISVKTNGTRRTYHWKTVYPMATYLAAVYSAAYANFNEEYESAAKIKMPIVYYVTPEKLESAKRDFSIHKEAIEVFSRLFGEYPFIKEKYGVAEFLWNKGALENQTITGLGSVFISGLGMQKDILIHELAHSWWGNSVSPKEWKDIWLNEGLATYSTALYYEAVSDIRSLFSTMRQYYGEFPKGTLYNPEADMFGRLIYDKGAWTFHMLRKEIGDSTFFRMLKEYYKNFSYKNASTADLQAVCESVSKKKLDYFFKQWVYEGIGIIKADYTYETVKQNDNSYNVRIIIKQVQDGFPVYCFPLDIQVNSGEEKKMLKTVYITKKESVFELKTDFLPQNVTLDPYGWVLAKFNKK